MGLSDGSERPWVEGRSSASEETGYTTRRVVSLAAFLIFGLGSGRLCWSISRVKPFTVRMQMPTWVQPLGIYIPVLYCLTCLSCHSCVDKSSEVNDVFIPSIRLDDNHYLSNPPFSFFIPSFQVVIHLITSA